MVETDEHPKPNATLDGLKKLRSLFKENGLVTAGTASVSVAIIIWVIIYKNNVLRESVMVQEL